MTPEEFKQELALHGIMLSDKQMKQFEDYYELLVDTNKVVNLTAITAKKEVYLKHFYDSLILGIEVPALRTEAATLCDVGAGAGFPFSVLRETLNFSMFHTTDKFNLFTH